MLPEQFSRWLPTSVAVAGFILQLTILSAWVGRLDQRLAAVEAHAADKVVHMPLTEKLTLFVPRAEYAAKVTQRDQEFSELRRAIENLGAKIDRFFERRQGK